MTTCFPKPRRRPIRTTFPGGVHPAQTGATEKNTLGYTFTTSTGPAVVDSVYHLTYTFAHSSSSLELDFNSLQNEGANEFWGLDNVKVTAN